METPSQRLSRVRRQIEAACLENDRRPETVRLLAVSKRHPPEAIRQLHALGQAAFGENYVDEALEKQHALTDPGVEWHYIGPVQSNKTRDLAEHFQWVQSVDREKILRRLSSQRPAHLPALNICLQVNIDQEPQKSGALPAALPGLAALATELPGLRLRGLMCIPRAWGETDRVRDSFARTRECYTALLRDGHHLDTLSMGMSGDVAPAIAEGSTMVRIGTALFGPRD